MSNDREISGIGLYKMTGIQNIEQRRPVITHQSKVYLNCTFEDLSYRTYDTYRFVVDMSYQVHLALYHPPQSPPDSGELVPIISGGMPKAGGGLWAMLFS
jgi:hypothetical protein